MKRFLKNAIWPIMLAPAVYLALIWKKIPATIPMKYNLKGEVIRYGSKNEMLWVVIILTVVSIGIYMLLRNAYRLDPKKSAVSNKERMNQMAFGISFFTTAFNALMIYYCSHPSEEFRFNLVMIGVGLLFAFIGNYMHSIRPNYFAGMRLPWTLENEDNWKLTHALAGKLWFAGGLLIAMISLITTSQLAMISMFGIMVVILLIPAIFSYRLYKKQSSQSAS